MERREEEKEVEKEVVEEEDEERKGGRMRWRGKGGVPFFINACERCLPCSFQGRTRKREVVGFTPTTLY